jgi:hypothetical protein
MHIARKGDDKKGEYFTLMMEAADSSESCVQ